jgi:uncharacterized protein YdhG (YjbR/CyaY superfamily)
MNAKTNSAKTASNSGDGFTSEEKAAMKARAQELKLEAKASKNREEGEKAIQDAISQMEGNDHLMAKRFHEIVTSNAPMLMPKTWYGMPAYTNSEGKVIFFFQSASKFNARYATIGFQHDAKLDDGNMWATSFAITKFTPAEEKRIGALIRQAVS